MSLTHFARLEPIDPRALSLRPGCSQSSDDHADDLDALVKHELPDRGADGFSWHYIPCRS
jgi:hypothetical protein